MVSPLAKYAQQTPDHTKTSPPPHLEIDFLIYSGATFIVLNNDTWNEIKKYQKSQSKTSTFVLSAANNSRLPSNWTVKLIFYPDVTKHRTYCNIILKLTFQVSNTKFNNSRDTVSRIFNEAIKCSSHTLDIKRNNDTKSLKFMIPQQNQLPTIHDYFLFLVITHSNFNFLNTEL